MVWGTMHWLQNTSFVVWKNRHKSGKTYGFSVTPGDSIVEPISAKGCVHINILGIVKDLKRAELENGCSLCESRNSERRAHRKKAKKKAWNMKNHNYDFKSIEFFPHGNYQVGL